MSGGQAVPSWELCEQGLAEGWSCPSVAMLTS